MEQIIESTNRRRELRQRATMNRFLFWAGAILVGVPLALVLLNAFIGWQPAVLAMPAALAAHSFWKRLRRKTAATKNGKPTKHVHLAYRLFGLATLAGIPLCSVSYGNPDIMRLWAPAVSIAFGVGMLKDFPNRGKPISGLHVATMLMPGFALLYTGASELIWAFLPFWSWLIFHGSILLGLTFCFLAVVEIYNWVFQNKSIDTELTKAKPPRAENGDRTERLQAQVKIANFAAMDYGTVRRSHASRLIDGLATVESPKLHSKDRIDLDYPRLQINFEGAHALVIARTGDSTFKLQTVFSYNPRSIFSVRNAVVNDITRVILDDILRLAWRDNWPAIDKQLDRLNAETM